MILSLWAVFDHQVCFKRQEDYLNTNIGRWRFFYSGALFNISQLLMYDNILSFSFAILLICLPL